MSRPYIPINKQGRVVSIIHLCIIFSYILWVGGYPFTGELYAVKSRKMVYESVINHPNYTNLPLYEQKTIKRAFSALQMRQSTPFLSKLKESGNILLFYISPYIRVWILLSLIIPVFLLFRIEGAVAISWLLPLVVLLGMGDGKTKITEEMRLFPSEQTLISKYIDEPYSRNISEQQRQLKNGWENYLIEEWSDDSADNRLSQGTLAFNLARVGAIEKDGFPSPRQFFGEKPSPFISLLNLCWSLIFAFTVTFRTVSRGKILSP